ncbi:MAG: lipoprotein [Tsuneonella suprasediminis]|uniref:Argininosuccinate lyase n=1 Tax=Tsuneonella suprasediminis TaxID=2306996 RepID=A0A419QZJ6_9SPHN|nr:lipoprotein [Tsuneonella suprasediminis]RJX66009.1 hypothetical protein D6858_13650 [Tsuneonella suprasediminis]UBS32651.1 lipoprotein [Altererythrobacter sp. N1]
MRKLATISALAALALFSGCGQKTALKPLAKQTLPPAPYGAKSQPDADQLLTPDAQAAPKRSVELRERSEERQDDPFDLPPQ